MSAGQLQQLLVPVFLLQLQDKVKNTTNMESSLWCWFTSRVMLPFSRNHETEADQIGLTLMAIAGYSRRSNWWTRMAAILTEKLHLSFSVHKSDASRIASLKAMIPQAKATAANLE
jgi:predicted Zn-dependent protease